MQFERLKKNHQKQVIIGGLILVCIISAITITTTKAKYKIANDLELAKGTINYKAYDFKIMAMYKSDDKTNYTEIEAMPSEGYTINESKSYCNMSNGNKDATAILKTIDGNHSISKLKKNDRCYLYFDKKGPENIPELIASLNAKTEAPDFSQIATDDEGVFITDDPMYGTNAKTYYWRGAATTNYLKFAGFCWRIVRINGDGTLRLIYDGTTCHQNGKSTTDNVIIGDNESDRYYATSDMQYNNSSYVGWTYSLGKQRPESNETAISSNAKTKTEKWYNNNIGKNTLYTSKVTEGKYCNDRNVGNPEFGYGSDWATIWSPNGTNFVYAAEDRIWNRNTPTLLCPNNDIYELKVGLITADEAMIAGGTSSDNEKYYLRTGQSYWTMSPLVWSGSGAVVFIVNEKGSLGFGGNVNGTYSLRPVINLRSDITFSGGDGTLNNPYIVAD